MAIEAFGKTDRGCVRTENEDRVLVDHTLGLYLVCDGMGGSKRGDLAAELAADAVRYYIGASRDRYDVSWPFGYTFELSLDANRVLTGVRLANRQVWRSAEQNLEFAGMGTTIAAVLICDGLAVVGNVGDTRVYLCRDNRLTQITTDDTMIASMVRKGLLLASEAASHPMRNVVTQAAGPQEEVEVHLHEETIATGDAFLICSDGLYTLVQEPDILAALADGGSPEAAAERLVNAAIDSGAPDNVSVVVLRYI
jgi:serine/threonine protein phosphatase PrpC